MSEPGRIFLGFCVKAPWVPNAAWFPHGETGVAAVCSVSDCLAERPPGWIDRWDFTRAGCYDNEATALGTVPPGVETRYVCFAYHLVPPALEFGGGRAPRAADELFDGRLPPLPVDAGPPAGYARLGYDAVSVGATAGFECSPLSCNGMVTEIPVNRWCLLDDLEHALDVAKRFDGEQPEPGDYVVIEVSARATDMAWGLPGT